jgi:hypothetical protein
MVGNHSCYREDPAFGGGQTCPGQMFGDNAPAATWQLSFTHADLGNPPAQFVGVPGNSPFLSEGPGINSPSPKSPAKNPAPVTNPTVPPFPGGGGGGGRGGGPPT